MEPKKRTDSASESPGRARSLLKKSRRPSARACESQSSPLSTASLTNRVSASTPEQTAELQTGAKQPACTHPAKHPKQSKTTSIGCINKITSRTCVTYSRCWGPHILQKPSAKRPQYSIRGPFAPVSVFAGGPKRGNSIMTTSTVTARRKGDPQNYVEGKTGCVNDKSHALFVSYGQ